MEVLQIFPSIIKDAEFKVTNPSECQPPLKCRQGQSFKLNGDISKRKYGLEIFFDNYYTNIDTDFILDIPTSCLIFFTTETAVPTVDNLYELYKQANHAMGWKIIEEASKHNLKADFLPENAPLELLKKAFNEIITKLFNE